MRKRHYQKLREFFADRIRPRVRPPGASRRGGYPRITITTSKRLRRGRRLTMAPAIAQPVAPPRELLPEDLRAYVDPDSLGFETTEEITSFRNAIGQPRAVEALQFGLTIRTQGFNIYVAGPTGTGRRSTVRQFIEEIAKKQPVPWDWCYVHNFDDPDKPLAISLPPGKACEFAEGMEEFLRTAQRELPRVFETEEYQHRRGEITSQIHRIRDEMLRNLEQEALKEGFALQVTPMGIFSVPIDRGKPLTPEEFHRLPEEERHQIEEKSQRIQLEIEEVVNKVRALEKQERELIAQLDREVALFAVGHYLDRLREQFKEFPKVLSYLEAVQEDVIRNLDNFRRVESSPPSPLPGVEEAQREALFNRYRVNVLVTHRREEGAPVVVETNPTYYNLFGRIEYRARLGTMTTDFSMIKPGAVHQANGGYLILQATDLFTHFFSWEALKRTLLSRQVTIENIGEQFSPFPAATLKPEPIPVDLKVILIGHPLLYYLLYAWDDDFRKLFKVRADFDIEMPKVPATIQEYAGFVAARCQEAGLKPFHKTAVARIIEYGTRLAEHQQKLSTRFLNIADLISEAAFWADQEDSDLVYARHVDKALEKSKFRSNLIEEKIREMIAEGTLLIDTEGVKIGQINGISVIDLGDYSFGRPTRITARTFLGRGGVIDIERETELGGPLHSKGVFILSGYLAGKYAVDKPMAVSASLAFEQSYEEIEGDSASSAEIYALLSSLAEVPIKQGIAVTGSVNQLGEVQAIGGVNEKIEGFFYVCKVKGFTGDQGVVIPEANVKHLALNDEVIEAVREGKFHIYPVRTVDEGIEVLTGIPAGQRLPNGRWEPGTINDRVDRRLRHFAEILREYGEEMEEVSPERGHIMRRHDSPQEGQEEED